MNAYTKKLIKCLESNSHADNAFHMKKYMRDQFDYYGIKTPKRRELLTTFIKENGLPDDSEMEIVAIELWECDKRECLYAAIELLARYKKKWTPQHIKLFEKLALKKSWWDSVDSVEGNLIGPYFKLFPEQIKPITTRWNSSKNIWLQRLSIIFQLMYKKETDEKLLFKYINNLKDSDEFFVQKAIGWALRQYARTNPGAVKKFTKSIKLKPLSLREATKHL